jgi:ElaB/YqjD/DUF883 family membrane-anchored ribosome-binding protein
LTVLDKRETEHSKNVLGELYTLYERNKREISSRDDNSRRLIHELESDIIQKIARQVAESATKVRDEFQENLQDLNKECRRYAQQIVGHTRDAME